MIDQSTMKAAVDELLQIDPAISQAEIVSYDGLVMVTTEQDRDAAETLAAIASELLGKGKLAVEELNLGDLHSEFVLGSTGGVMIRYINEEMVLVVAVDLKVNVGKVAAAMNRTAARMNQVF